MIDAGDGVALVSRHVASGNERIDDGFLGREYRGVEQRVRLLRGPGGPEIRLWTGERVAAEGSLPQGEPRLSLEGRFTAPDRLRVERYAVQRFDRDWPSYTGLLLLAALWLRPRLRRPGRAATPA